LEYQVVAEASDGEEAVQRAEELKPDLIVLDIGLPKLNGIEAVRGIRRVSPSTKVVILSQNNDLGVVQAALDAGAVGYVPKTNVGAELLPAVNAVLQGKQFVSTSIKGYESSDPVGGKSSLTAMRFCSIRITRSSR
jgi:DNA-binding NarL/FixJ family response regulator